MPKPSAGVKSRLPWLAQRLYPPPSSTVTDDSRSSVPLAVDPPTPPPAGPRSAGTVLVALLAIAVGTALGIGAFTFRYAEGLSYLSSDPRACVNCHIMRPQYDSWQKASHHAVATCVDCHLPTGFVAKYLAKASNGWHHSKGFTLQDFDEPIRVKPGNAAILQENCLRCHEPMVDLLVSGAKTDRDAVVCVHCHAGVGHGERTGLGPGLRREAHLGSSATLTEERTAASP
ncbi:MAG: cytochrome c nitrite reductase small subunit [Polyangiaceae bacterium]|nr:cytochrome c nitrite reductase small subunit [Polyangiaceae bacterium]